MLDLGRSQWEKDPDLTTEEVLERLPEPERSRAIELLWQVSLLRRPR
jgi:hypothetical protein